MEDSTSELIEYARKQVFESCEVKRLSSGLLSKLCSVSDRTAKAMKEGHCVFFCGNGGSAADAQHLAARIRRSIPPGKAPPFLRWL